MKPNVEDLVRCDRTGLYDRYGMWRYFPQQGPIYGDLWLTYDGRLGYTKVSRMGSGWDMTLSDVNHVSRVDASAYFWCNGLRPDMSLEADFGGKRRLVYFTGITIFMSQAEKLLSHVPGIHHAGALVIGVKSAVQNRDWRIQGKAALEAWLKILDGSTEPSDYPRLVQTG